MKKVFLLVLMLAAIYAGFAAKVNLTDAQLVARNFCFERSGLSYDDIRINYHYTEMEDGNALYYVFRINDKGFILISADDACHPVIGYSFENPYFTGDIPAHFQYWMEHYKGQIKLAITTGMIPDETTTAQWNYLRTTDPANLNLMDASRAVAPLLTDLWDQIFPWNQMCPEDNCFGGHVPVGCVATAMTQIMHYWRHPITGVGYHCISPLPPYGPQCADFGNTTYYWNGMTDSPNKQCDPVAELSWHGGISVNMDYDCDGSGSHTNRVPYALRTYFRYSNSALYCEKQYYSTADWNTLLQNDLNAGKPIEYSGSGSGGGHAWVCDGYQGTDYYHMNWGWSGSANGYYYLNNLNPGGYTFNQYQSAVVHITPDATYGTACSGTTIIDDWDFGSFEDGSGPVADYQNNLNCSWLIAPDDSVENITLSFVRFETQTGDEVKVYDGTSASAPLLGTYSGTTLPADITSTGPALFVTFTTNGSGTEQGWLAEYQASTIKFCESTTYLTDPTGDITDGSDRFLYRNSSNCKWKITPSNASTVTISFTEFDTELDKDKLQIYDLQAGSLLALYTGEYTTPPPPVTSPSGQMMLIFTSNNAVRGEGFYSSYDITTGQPAMQGLDGVTIYPNPVEDQLAIHFFSTLVQRVNIEFTSMNGSMMLSESIRAEKGNINHNLDVSSFARGIYLLRITTDQGIGTFKVVLK
jgi:hypothetical protein